MRHLRSPSGLAPTRCRRLKRAIDAPALQGDGTAEPTPGALRHGIGLRGLVRATDGPRIRGSCSSPGRSGLGFGRAPGNPTVAIAVCQKANSNMTDMSCSGSRAWRRASGRGSATGPRLSIRTARTGASPQHSKSSRRPALPVRRARALRRSPATHCRAQGSAASTARGGCGGAGTRDMANRRDDEENLCSRREPPFLRSDQASPERPTDERELEEADGTRDRRDERNHPGPLQLDADRGCRRRPVCVSHGSVPNDARMGHSLVARTCGSTLRSAGRPVERFRASPRYALRVL